MIQVLLADDHKLVRSGLKSLLSEKTGDMTVVAEASTGLEVLALLETTPADVVLMDIYMPNMNGIEATRQIRERFPQVKVLMLTMTDTPQWVNESLEAGAQGYLLKSTGYKELLFAIRTVYEGEAYFSTDLTKLLLQQVNAGAKGVAATPQVDGNSQGTAQPLSAGITPRELDVLRLIAQGYTNQQNGEMLLTSKRTIESHRQNLLEKTGAGNTATLVLYAAHHGLLE